MANVYQFRQWSLALLRVIVGVIFAYHGYLKLFVPGGFKGTIAFFGAIGIPMPVYSALLVSVVEFAGGLFLILGFLAKWASVLLIINMAVALFKVHLKNGFLIANSGFEFVGLLIFSSLVILLNGSGNLSLDRIIFGAEEEPKEASEAKSSRKSRISVKNVSGSVVVARTGISKEPGYLYFLDKKGHVARVRMARRGKRTTKKQEVLLKLWVERKQGYLYYIDGNGDVAQSRMARG